MARPKGNRKEARLSVSLDEQEYAELCSLARRDDVSVAWMVRQAIHNLIRLEEEKARNPALPFPRKLSHSRQATS
jgi:hypothetical protein